MSELYRRECLNGRSASGLDTQRTSISRIAFSALFVSLVSCGSSGDGGESQGSGAGGTAPGSGGAPATGGALGSGGAAPGAGGTSETASGGEASTGGTPNTSSGGSGGAAVGGSGGASGGTGGSEGTGGDGTGGEASSDVTPSEGCGTNPSLQDGTITLQSGGVDRTYVLRLPESYDNSEPYRVIFGFHGATGSSADVAPGFFGLWDLSADSTIFIAPDAVGGLWNADADTVLMDEILAQVESDLCIDTSRIFLEGFSQGGAMTWTLACARPSVYRAAVVHSGGGLSRPDSCEPIPFFSSLGQSESNGAGQTSNSDFFAGENGCTVEPLPQAPSGGHVCTDYADCLEGSPTRWCDYDGGHTPSPTDGGQGSSWMPAEVWEFFERF